MGKFGHGNGSDPQIGEPTTSDSSSRSFCGRCRPMGGIAQYFSFKCLLVLILSLAVFISAIFWIIPSRSLHSGYDASQTVKLSASIQAYFRLQKPVSLLVPHIRQLEDEINKEIGVPDTKVTIISMHKSRIPNSTYIVFGFLPHPEGVSVHPVSLSVLKSSLISLFLQESNLTLTSSTFGVPTSFEIVKFSRGITVIPRQPAPVAQIIQTLFSFTLNNSIYDVKSNLDLLTKQLKTGLHLNFNENVYVQVTNRAGSTTDPPVIVQASVLSEMGSLEPQRLKQLAQTIQNSTYSKNLGLNNTMFGRVKYISLSSYMSQTLKPNPPSSAPSPSPSPEPCSSSQPHNSAPPCSDYGAQAPSPTRSVPQSSAYASVAQPAYDAAISPSFHPLPFKHHMFMQAADKSSADLSAPQRIFFSVTTKENHSTSGPLE
ncbi:hypothetical protein V2J09_009847 [Rumex salicifolius]